MHVPRMAHRDHSQFDRWPLPPALLRAIVSVNQWYIIVIVIVAILLGLFGAFLRASFLWALILFYVIAWILLLVFTRVAATLAADLAKHGQAILDAITKVLASCPAGSKSSKAASVSDR